MCYLYKLHMIREPEAHSFPIQLTNYKNMSLVYSFIMWYFRECFKELVIVNILGRIRGSYLDLFMRIQYFNHLL